MPKFPGDFGSVAFEPDKPSVPPGGQTILRWQGDPATKYTLSWPGQKPIVVANHGLRKTPPLNKDTQFTLTVHLQRDGVNVKHPYSVLVQVTTAELSIGADRLKIHSGESVTLSLTIENATNCVLESTPAGGETNEEQIHPKQIVNGRATVPVTPTKTTQYVLRGQDEQDMWHISDPLPVTVYPKAPAAKADLVFIKTANTKNTQGNVEIHALDGARQYQQPFVDITTGFPVADAAIGRWAMAHFWASGDPAQTRDLVHVKTADTGSDRIQVSITEVQAPYHPDQVIPPYTPNPQRPPYPEPQVKLDRAAKGVWALAPMVAHKSGTTLPELVFIQTADTASGHVEVYADNAAVWGYSVESAGPWTSVYPIADGPNGTWLLADMTGRGTPPPDLVFVQTAGTSTGTVQVSYARGADGYKTRSDTWDADFDIDDGAADGTWGLADMTGEGHPDLVFIKTAKTASSRIEIYYWPYAQQYQHRFGGCTALDVAEGPNGTWAVVKYA